MMLFISNLAHRIADWADSYIEQDDPRLIEKLKALADVRIR